MMLVVALASFLTALTAAANAAGLIDDVRTLINRGDFAQAEQLIASYRARQGLTSEMLEALSWLGRGALAARNLDAAERYATETRTLVDQYLNSHPVDADRHLPIALGASIEVLAQTAAARGERDQALQYLQQQLAQFRNTSIATRLRKNINLLSLEGKPAPPLSPQHWIGRRPPEWRQLEGRPALLFLWAHWCGDCKAMAPVLARLRQEFEPKGLTIIAHTRFWGYAERGREVGPQEELKHVENILLEHYSGLRGIPVSIGDGSFQLYGASTTPTFVLIDGRGLVRLYRPGRMSYEELAEKIRPLLGS